MHVLIAADQHPATLGGVQVAIGLQRRFLERLGHRVTIVAPAMRRPGSAPTSADRASVIALPSVAITRDREYAAAWPGAAADRVLAAGLREREPVDLVHLQGDFWGALAGLRAARGLGVPVVHTLHNHVEAGTRAVTPLASAVFRLLRLWRSLALGPAPAGTQHRARGAWRYLAELAAAAVAVTAPSQHFADELVRRGVADEVLVTPTGVDDDEIAAVRAMPRSPRGRPRLVWLGRMSGEKRVLEFVEAVARSGIDADVDLYGAGLLLPRVRTLVEELGLADRATVHGPVPHRAALEAMHDADALVQTSLGFETQGLTPFEAAAIGTPTIYCDSAIASDVGVVPEWRAAGPTVEALAATLRRAFGDLSAVDPLALRVPRAAARSLSQSARTERMLEIYEGALARR